MKVGFRCSEGGPVFDEALAQAEYAEELGFDSVWVAEHHGWDAFWPSSHLALAGIATRTTDIELGTSVTLLPQANPVRLAGEIALLDQIADGRVTLGVGVGWRRPEMENLGYEFESRGPRMTEHLRTLRQLWRKETVSMDGEFVTLSDFSLSPRPVQDPHPPVWVGGDVDVSLKRAARLGEAWVPVWRMSIDELAERFDRYESYVRAAGDDPADRQRPLMRSAWISEDTGDAEAEMKAMFRRLIESYREMGAGAYEPLERAIESDFRSFAEDRFIYGSPADCARQLDRYEQELGPDHLILKLANPGVSHERILRFLELFGDEVLPTVA
ncbi:MAG: LLM class flavin-dependent oxidoreductase [Salinirussus sp.]